MANGLLGGLGRFAQTAGLTVGTTVSLFFGATTLNTVPPIEKKSELRMEVDEWLADKPESDYKDKLQREIDNWLDEPKPAPYKKKEEMKMRSLRKHLAAEWDKMATDPRRPPSAPQLLYIERRHERPNHHGWLRIHRREHGVKSKRQV